MGQILSAYGQGQQGQYGTQQSYRPYQQKQQYGALPNRNAPQQNGYVTGSNPLYNVRNVPTGYGPGSHSPENNNPPHGFIDWRP